jgi:undecaprenyl diphosphate synthase
MVQQKELLVHVFGRVQGVGFRQFVKHQANLLGLRGFVRNEHDGSVLVLAQGEKSLLESLLRSVRRGPRFSKVTSISYAWKTPSTFYDYFSVNVDKGFISDQTSSFTHLGKELLHLQKPCPLHVAIIPDGNRRWAKKQGFAAVKGHALAAAPQRIRALLNESRRLGIRYLTLWAFSTDNWKRDRAEIVSLFKVIKSTLRWFSDELVKQQINFRHLGRRDRLPSELVSEIERLEHVTKQFTEYHVLLCLDYGGRDELVRAINKLLTSGVKTVTEEDIIRFLDTEGVPDPDLVIRTSGEQRTSGFMPFQTTYSELYFTKCSFPEFGPAELKKAVESFAQRKRRFGGN